MEKGWTVKNVSIAIMNRVILELRNQSFSIRKTRCEISTRKKLGALKIMNPAQFRARMDSTSLRKSEIANIFKSVDTNSFEFKLEVIGPPEWIVLNGEAPQDWGSL